MCAPSLHPLFNLTTIWAQVRRTFVDTIALAFLTSSIFMTPVHAFNERIVFDPNTGIALMGYDPIGYHVNLLPRVGSPNFEWFYDGVAWRFANIGNMKIFMNDPDRYAPRFGGYDPVSLSRGQIVAGDPRVFAIYKNKLYLFFSISSKSTFLLEQTHFNAEAEKQWDTLKKTLLVQ